MNNKKSLMFLSCLLILIFHLWINISNSSIELFFKYICVIGVDIFFFISAYNIASKKRINYKEFIINRFSHIYFKFIIFTSIFIIYIKSDISTYLKIVSGYDFIINAGGSFLWFLPSIFIVYLLLPLYKKYDKKIISIVSVILIYILLIVILYKINKYDLFIFINRIPIIMIGYYFAWIDLNKIRNNRLISFISLILLFIVGIFISYYVFDKRLTNSLFYDFGYIFNIPVIISIILLVDNIKENKFISLVGSATLEIYAVQMIIGFKLTNSVYTLLKNVILTNIVSISMVIMISVVLKVILDKYISILKAEN